MSEIPNASQEDLVDMQLAENAVNFLQGRFSSGVVLLSKYDGQKTGFFSFGFGDHFARRGMLESFMDATYDSSFDG